ncbi:DNA topoisomerase type II [Klebsormidium nitens]|uniref:DNA topoisomerase 2 n=1 Tax=Klebsormidium nitens TaxID=105231 RepID=A0A1Y1HP43_KLENI|nr:DNA topoisomerase type II [Klebsormidium nitens]|eukprot:GAQ80404.1 DNA topoisomerase type II [Klebsormidium nitens]
MRAHDWNAPGRRHKGRTGRRPRSRLAPHAAASARSAVILEPIKPANPAVVLTQGKAGCWTDQVLVKRSHCKGATEALTAEHSTFKQHIRLERWILIMRSKRMWCPSKQQRPQKQKLQSPAMGLHSKASPLTTDVKFVPGLYKIFDEILVNAADNKQRDSSMDSLKVTIDPESNTISVYNNGAGLPVEVHAEEGVYVPELVFGHLLTSSNYDDSQKKTTGGRNGYGAKLTNIFSTEFVIETADGARGRKYKQVFSNNMGVKGKPEIKSCKPTDNWTRVTFKPDLSKFNMDHLEADVVALMSKRVCDMAGCLGKTVKVELNGSRLPIKDFSDYVNMFMRPTNNARKEQGQPELDRFYHKTDRWEVVVSQSGGQFQQVSFVNSICTTKGGSHVNYVTDQVVNHVMDWIKNSKKKDVKSAGVKNFHVKNHLWVFVNALVDNPAFDSQTKETLTTRQAQFGSTCQLPEKILKNVVNSDIVHAALSVASAKLQKDLKKTDGAKRTRLVGIQKLDDANDAGGRYSADCTLILTEGDSAKTLAVSGLGVVGRDKYGVFPLRGKLLNVRDASTKQITDNAEISLIKQIMGLQHGKVYEDTKALRYGHLMIMTDQDHDGSHIKGLLINFLHSFWPSLLKIPGFLLEFITPIVKATHGNQKLSFYTIPEYESWKESLGPAAKNWSIKYYKGLGTSTPLEAKEYFADLDMHQKEFRWTGEQDGDCIELAFSKKKIEARKAWLSNCEPGTFLDQSVDVIPYHDFVNKELILFSMADLARSIPSAVDGFKPGQRKILFGCFKHKVKKSVKVGILQGIISSSTAYHHGDTSLQATIIGMAQNFVGSQNINVLNPEGMFGSRLMGGKDASQPRYISTRLEKVARAIFPQLDDNVLTYLDDDGLSIEPQWYVPILPMVLVNGSEGIGTGWSSFVPQYNPREIAENIKRMLDGQEPTPMTPWYRGFTGTIEKNGDKSYTLSGRISKVDDTTLEITELPVRRWSTDYKEFLEGLLTGGEKNEQPFIKDYRDNGGDFKVQFTVQLSEERMKEAEAAGLLKKFKLTTTVSTSNMHLFNSKGKITKYDTPEQILADFFPLRLEYYKKRKAYMMEDARFEVRKISNRVRFILDVVEKRLEVRNRKKADLVAELAHKGFDAMPKARMKRAHVAQPAAEDGDSDGEGADAAAKAPDGASYDYLLSMPLWTLTAERVQDLLRTKQEEETKLADLEGLPEATMWRTDLDYFLQVLDEKDVEDAEQAASHMKNAAKGNKSRKGAGKPGKAAGKKKKKGDDSGEESDDEYTGEKKKVVKRPPAAPKPKPAASASTQLKPSTSASTAATASTSGPSKASSSLATSKPKPPPAPASAAPIEEEDEDEEEDLMSMSLTERLTHLAKQGLQTKKATQEATAPVPAAAASKGAGKRPAAKKAVISESSDETDRESGRAVDRAPPAKPPAGAAKPRAAARKTFQIDSDSEEEDADLADIPPPKAAPARPARVPAKKSYQIEDSDDESDGGSENEADEAAPPPPAPKPKAVAAPKPKPAAKKSSKVLSSEESDFEPEDEDSDFEEPKPKKKLAPKKLAPLPAKAPRAPKPPAAAGKKRTLGAKAPKILSDTEESQAGTSPNDDADVPVDSPARKSPDKKVRRMRPSPFNKKSGSLLAAAPVTKGPALDLEAGADEAPGGGGRRPARAARNQISYVDLDGESEEDEASDEEFSE